MGTCQALRPGGGRTGRTGTQIQQGSLRAPQSGLPAPPPRDVPPEGVAGRGREWRRAPPQPQPLGTVPALGLNRR